MWECTLGGREERRGHGGARGEKGDGGGIGGSMCYIVVGECEWWWCCEEERGEELCAGELWEVFDAI